jgi:hypothetical protein
MSAQEASERKKKALDVRGTWLEQQALDFTRIRWHRQGAQVRTSQVEVALAYNVGVTTRRKMTNLHRENLRGTRPGRASLRFSLWISLPPIRSSGTWREGPPKLPHSSGLLAARQRSEAPTMSFDIGGGKLQKDCLLMMAV